MGTVIAQTFSLAMEVGRPESRRRLEGPGLQPPVERLAVDELHDETIFENASWRAPTLLADVVGVVGSRYNPAR